MELSRKLGMNPFEIMEQNVDYVIMIINYYINTNSNENNLPKPQTATKKAAYDGFWDF